MALQQMLRHVRSTPATAFAKGFATSASMLAIGDLLCQGIQKGGVKALASDWDAKRTARFGLIGLTLHGPTFFTGFRCVDGFYGHSTATIQVLKKTATVQLLIFPPFLAAFFYYARRLEGRGHSSGVQSIRDNFANAFIAGSCYWPFVNIVNFRFVSGDKRILLASSAAVLYNAFLSYINARGPPPSLQVKPLQKQQHKLA